MEVRILPRQPTSPVSASGETGGAIIAPLRGFPALAGGLWIPKFHGEARPLPKISGRFRRYSQIFGDASRRLVRSSTAWWGRPFL